MGKTYILDVTPCPKPRMTRRDKWKHRPIVDRYYAFKDELRFKANKLGLNTLTDKLKIEFFIPMPDSWSEKKKKEMALKPHQIKRRNDTDNLEKSVLDAFTKEDGEIWHLTGIKMWDYKGKIIITVYDN